MNEIVDNIEILSAILDIQRSDDEIVQDIGNVQKELMGFKRLVLTQLVDINQKLTTLTDVLLPPTPREMTPPGTGDPVTVPPTGEESPSARVLAGASLTEASAPAGQEPPDQSVLPDAQDGECDREMRSLEC
jgi:hypothetical protein